MKWVKNTFFAFIVFIFVYLIIGQLFLPKDTPDTGAVCEEFVSDWVKVEKDGSRTPVVIPGEVEKEDGEIITVETVIPKLPDGTTCISIHSIRQNMEIYIDNEKRLSYSTDNTRPFGMESAVVFLFVPVTQNDTGKTLRLEVRSNKDGVEKFYTTFVGSKLGVWKHFFVKFGTELIVAVIVFAISIIVIVVCLFLTRLYKMHINLIYLGFGVGLASWWVLCNSIFRQLIFENISTISDVTFMIVGLVIFPFLIYMNNVQSYRYNKVYNIAETAVVVDYIICVALHMMRILDFSKSIIITNSISVIGIFIICTTVIIDIKNKKIHEYKYVAIGIISAVLSALFQIVLYFADTSNFSGTMLAIGLSMLLCCAVIHSITIVTDMEKERQKAIVASKSKGKFLANMSHEIRTPITAILGFNTMIIRESNEDNVREYAEDIDKAGHTLLNIINDILDFSKIESGKMEIFCEDYDLFALVHEVVSMITIKANEKGIKLELELDRRIPPALHGDDVRIRQILVNLLNNAVKYTDKGSVKMSVRGEREDNTVVLHVEVIDTGIGIKEADLNRIFSEFERVEDNYNRKVEGTGLGISITAQLLNLMGSKLQAKSVYGQGSTFYFDLRQLVRDVDAAESQKPQVISPDISENSHFTAPNAKILVVDDNAVNRKVVASLLKHIKINIEEADGGKLALVKIAAQKYDIIFLDHMMPDMNGIEVIKEMHKWNDYPNKKTPVIVLTANAISGAKEEYLSCGFTDYLSKPINAKKLEEYIRKYLPENKVYVNSDASSEASAPVSVPESGQDELPQVDGVDWDYARVKLGDDSIIRTVVDEFSITAENEIQSLVHLFVELEGADEDNRDEAFAQFRIKAHSMKTTTATFGATTLSSVAKILEYAAKDKDIDRIRSLIGLFANDWRTLKNNIDFAFPRETINEDKPPIDKEKMIFCLDKLVDALKDVDADMADEISEELQRYSYSAAIKDKMDLIYSAVCSLDGDAAEAIVNDIKLLIYKND